VWLICAAADGACFEAWPEDRACAEDALTAAWTAGRCATRSGGFAVAAPPAVPKAEATIAARAAGAVTLAAAEVKLTRPELLPGIQASARWGETASSVQKSTARLPE
jgi:hypothetical protein